MFIKTLKILGLAWLASNTYWFVYTWKHTDDRGRFLNPDPAAHPWPINNMLKNGTLK